MERRRVRGRALLLAFVLVCVAVITLDFKQVQTDPLDRAQELAATLVTPLQRGFTLVVARPIGNFFSSVAELGNLRTENDRLRASLERSRAEAEQAEGFETDNIRLREELELGKSWASMKTVTAQVIGNVPTNWRFAVQIDKGRAAGLRPDMAVIEPDGAVGKIVRPLTGDTATVLLLIDPAGAAGARIEDAEISGLITGGGSTENLSMELVGNDAEVSAGDEVQTSSLNNGIFPPGIDIGRVVSVGEERAALEKQIEVAPSVNFRDLDYLDILLETGPRIADKGSGDRGG